ncbi:hypothetical protein [Mycobacterium sp. IDR2000157661]|uniref:hypothetical protein n=1 Tax=Mycobacterium sp. IDR2000157661 TaxID=2867005 RepID=UPI001EECBDEB|nr:hypothetical protein [Mycobacterium sp. IDR2000157661]ULE33451.1 hypothetical protein K3G64_01670 [Mycobacterium sp. IDR2000157661]
MERLPYIDEHVITVDADRAATWSALLRLWVRDPTDPSTVRSPFFWLDEAVDRERLALCGEHPFSVYKLVFDLDDEGPGRTRMSARSWARFPGISGQAYQMAVIGTGAHRVAVRLLLKRIAAQAVRPPTAVA